MNIYDSQGKLMGTLNKPEPVLYSGMWWEFNTIRIAKEGEQYYDSGHLFYAGCLHTKETWIATKIPTPTAEQLKAIGMRCRDTEPMRYTIDDKIWTEHGVSEVRDATGSTRYRWVLVPVEKGERADCSTRQKFISKKCSGYYVALCAGYCKPPAPQDKGAVHTSCEGCECKTQEDMEEFFLRGTSEIVPDNCWHCFEFTRPDQERKNYTAALHPAPDCDDCAKRPHCPGEGKGLEKYEELLKQYQELLFAVANKYPNESRHETALRYIREREYPKSETGAQRAEEAEPVFTVGEIEWIRKWLTSKADRWPQDRYFNETVRELNKDLNDPVDGLNAVANRKGG